MNNNEVQTSMMTMMWLLMTCSDDGACMFNSKNAHDLLGNWSSISFRLHLHTYSMLIALVARHTILGSVRCYETWAFLAFLLLHWYTCRMEHVNVSVTLHFANLD